MTGFTRHGGKCSQCGIPLKLGDMPRAIAYPSAVVIIAVCWYSVFYLHDVILLFPITISVITMVLSFLLGFLLTYYVRGVAQDDDADAR